jgi:hypothetical protein
MLVDLVNNQKEASMPVINFFYAGSSNCWVVVVTGMPFAIKNADIVSIGGALWSVKKAQPFGATNLEFHGQVLDIIPELSEP